MVKFFAVLFATCLLAVTFSASAAETKVMLSDVHICCKSCVSDIETHLKEVKGITYTVNKEGGTVALVAQDTASAQAGVDALATAGYHGKSDSKEVMMKDSAAPEGKVAKAEVSNIHNCCGKCTTAIEKAVKAVPGVKELTLKPKATTFEVTGDFDAKALAKALNDAGFQATVK